MKVRVLLEPARIRRDRLRWFRRSLLMFAVAALGYTGYAYLDAIIYQFREDRILEETAAGSVGGTPDRSTDRPAYPKRLDPESPIGRIVIARLNVRAVVKEGVDSKTLRRAVGHVPGTALPGEDGNVALAAHRDTFFRGLRDVRKDDRITVQTADREYEYVVDSTKIVTPKDVHVLKPTGSPVLTLVTCYPFNYVGHAPKRFIVRARQIAVTPRETQGS